MNCSLVPLALAFLPAPAADAPGGWSTSFDPPGLYGRVFALGEHDGRLVAGGLALQSDGEALTHAAVLDGGQWRPLGAGIAGTVRDFALFEGDLVACGRFSQAGGVPASSIARWDGEQWHSLGGGLEHSFALEAEVWDVEVFAGDLYASGEFDTAGGQSIVGLARWDGTAWSQVGGGIGADFQPAVYALEATADALYVGGVFGESGTSGSGNVARWDGTGWTSLGTLGSPDIVFALQEHDGILYAGGTFQTANGVPARRIAAWDGVQWSGLGTGIPDWDIAAFVYALESFGGELYVGGTFVEAGSAPAPRVARWDGQAWHGVGGVSGSALKTGVFALKGLGQRLYAGGEFSRAGTSFGVGGPVVTHSVAGLDPATGAWEQVGRGLGLDAEVFDLVRWSGGVVAVGRFAEAGESLTSEVALFGGMDWRPLGQFDGIVNDALVFEGDLVVTGSFDHVDGEPLSGVARYDGTAWSGFGEGAGGEALAVFGGELYAAGVGGARRWTGAEWVPFGETLSGVVLTMHAHGGTLYIGGSFNAFPWSTGPGPNVAAWDGVRMTSLGGGTDDAVETLASWDGELLVGGRFSGVDGGTSAPLVATWDGSSWSAFGPPLSGFVAMDFEVLNGSLYATGDLVFGDTDPADYVARWDGNAWQPLGGGIDGQGYALLGEEGTGRLWVGGWFFHAGAGTLGSGAPSWYAARFDTRETWADLGAGLGFPEPPRLEATGTLLPGEPLSFTVAGAPAWTFGVRAFGLSKIDVSAFGGLLVPSVDAQTSFVTGWLGSAKASGALPDPLPPGTPVYVQDWIVDPTAPDGLVATNAVRATAP